MALPVGCWADLSFLVVRWLCPGLLWAREVRMAWTGRWARLGTERTAISRGGHSQWVAVEICRVTEGAALAAFAEGETRLLVCTSEPRFNLSVFGSVAGL